MAVEIEKKYRLRPEREEPLRARLAEAGAQRLGVEVEENTLYAGGNLDPRTRVLRLRRVAGRRRATLTYKERSDSPSPVKRQREEETGVEDAEAAAAILAALGYSPTLVYEKRRTTWRLGDVEVVIDELPFGLFVEIEGAEEAILKAERLLGLADAEAEHATYPELARRHGTRRGDRIEARFAS